LNQLRKAKYISTLDLKCGLSATKWKIGKRRVPRTKKALYLESAKRGKVYQHTRSKVRIQPTIHSVHSTGLRLFQWKVTPLARTTAPATFQRALDTVIGPEMGPYAFAYLYDIVVIGRNKREHLQKLKEVFSIWTNKKQ